MPRFKYLTTSGDILYFVPGVTWITALLSKAATCSAKNSPSLAKAIINSMHNVLTLVISTNTVQVVEPIVYYIVVKGPTHSVGRGEGLTSNGQHTTLRQGKAHAGICAESSLESAKVYPLAS